MATNKILVRFWLEEGLDAKEEVAHLWSPINFAIYSELFQEIVDEAAISFIQENDIPVERDVEVIFEHIMERDGAGAAMDEYFEPIHTDWSIEKTISLD